jgi:prophage regulatory protein
METSQPPQFLTIKQVVAITGMSRSAIYVAMPDGRFPKHVNPYEGSRSVRWIPAEIYEWVERRLALAREAREARETGKLPQRTNPLSGSSGASLAPEQTAQD